MRRARLFSALGANGRAIESCFDDMGDAEAALEAAGIARGPLDCFRELRRPTLLAGRARWLYQSHVRELCERAAAGGVPLALGTLAEVVVVMSETGLRAPLNSDGSSIVHAAMLAVAPDVAQRIWSDPHDIPREPWPGYIDEQTTAIRKRIGAHPRWA